MSSSLLKFTTTCWLSRKPPKKQLFVTNFVLWFSAEYCWSKVTWEPTRMDAGPHGIASFLWDGTNVFLSSKGKGNEQQGWFLKTDSWRLSGYRQHFYDYSGMSLSFMKINVWHWSFPDVWKAKTMRPFWWCNTWQYFFSFFFNKNENVAVIACKAFLTGAAWTNGS